MYFINLFKYNLVIFASIVIVFLSGCSSATKRSDLAATNQKDTRISAEELAQLKTSSQQWQSAKEGVERLLIIEEDLKLLISQLNAVVKQEANSNEVPQTPIVSTQKKITKAPKTPSSTVTVKADKSVAKPLIDETNKLKKTTHTNSKTVEELPITALYALQVAAVTDKARLKQSLNEIKSNAPALFQGPLIANIESTNIGGVTYYRLKLGAYETQANAKAGCDKLKKQQINCIVSYYTQAPLNN